MSETLVGSEGKVLAVTGRLAIDGCIVRASARCKADIGKPDSGRKLPPNVLAPPREESCQSPGVVITS